MPKVSVIIPLYNGKRFIKETLDSVFKQTYKDFETIIVNDGSTDNPEEVLKPYLPKIKYITQKNSGCPAGAKNRGIAESSGYYLAFLDQDDIWKKDKLAEQVKILEKEPRIGLVATNAIYFQDRTKKRIGVVWDKIKKELTPKEARSKLIKNNFICSSSSVMIRKNTLEKNQYFDDRFKLADDYELWYRISRKWFFGLVAKPLIYYRFYNQSLSKNQHKLLKDTVLFYKIISRDKILTKEERKFALKQKALFNFRLANILMATNKFEEAKIIYQKLRKEDQFKNKIKIIKSLSLISPKIAGIIIKTKKMFSDTKKLRAK